MNNFEILIDKYTSLRIDEYNGTYSITQGYINKEGLFSPSFCKREFGR